MGQKKIGLCGMGNSLVDVFAKVDDATFSRLDRTKGSMELVDSVKQADILAKLSDGNHPQVSGGSVANSVYAFAQLGGAAAFLTSLGGDERGEFYRGEFGERGVVVPSPITSENPTGTSLVVVTSDAERTMSTDLGAAVALSEAHVCSNTVSGSEWLFIEGYVFSNSEPSRQAIQRAVQVAKKAGTKVALTLSDTWVVHAFGPAINEIISEIDLLFANESEAYAFTQTTDLTAAQASLADKVPNYVITRGPQGAIASFDQTTTVIDAFPCEPVDLTGAGDMFAGVFLYCLHQGLSVQNAGTNACRMAAEVIKQVGARLPDESFQLISHRMAS